MHENNDIIANIDILDLELSNNKNTLLSIFGANISNYRSILTNNPNKYFNKIINLGIVIHHLLDSIKSEESTFLNLLNTRQAKLKKNIDQLSDLRLIYKKYPDIEDI